MAYIYRTKDKNGKEHARWKIQYSDYRGIRRTKAGYASKVETEKLARALEEQSRRIRDGLEAAPGTAHHSRRLPVREVFDEYLAWGKSQSWSACHADHREMQLNWWISELKLTTLVDLDNLLPRVEKALRKLSQGEPEPTEVKKKSVKTVNHYANALKAFCTWCTDRNYLEQNPLRRMKLAKALPNKRRRALTVEEIQALLNVAPQHRRILYLVVLSTGLRANELRSLRVEDFDFERRGLNLRADWTKNRKVGFAYLPDAVALELKTFAESGGARRCYELAHGDCESIKAFPTRPLLYVPNHMADRIRTDLKAANIPVETHEGVVDFHATRTTFITLVYDLGGSTREAMTLARHSSPSMTLNTYARTREARLPEITEKIGAIFGCDSKEVGEG